MSPDMFYGPRTRWKDLNPAQVVALRALAPSGVFTLQTISAYIDQVEGRPDLQEIALALAADDNGFANQLPREWKPQVVALMKIAYRNGIRSADDRIERIPS